jgi:hypothetical protein
MWNRSLVYKNSERPKNVAEVIYGYSHKVESKYNVRCIVRYYLKRWCYSHDCQNHFIERQDSHRKWQQNGAYTYFWPITFFVPVCICSRKRTYNASKVLTDSTFKVNGWHVPGLCYTSLLWYRNVPAKAWLHTRLGTPLLQALRSHMQSEFAAIAEDAAGHNSAEQNWKRILF